MIKTRCIILYTQYIVTVNNILRVSIISVTFCMHTASYHNTRRMYTKYARLCENYATCRVRWLYMYLRINLQVTFKCARRRRVGTHARRGLYNNMLKSKPYACNPKLGRREKNKMTISQLLKNIFCKYREWKKDNPKNSYGWCAIMRLR